MSENNLVLENLGNLLQDFSPEDESTIAGGRSVRRCYRVRTRFGGIRIRCRRFLSRRTRFQR